MRKAIIVSSPNAYRMNSDLLADAVGLCFRDLGFDVLHLTRHARPTPTSDDDILMFMQMGVPEQFHDLRGTKILYNFHPTAPDLGYGKHARRNFESVRRGLRVADWVFEYNPHTAGWMRDAGLPAVFCPIGYHPSFDRSDVEPADVDSGAVFVGNARGSRRKTVEACGARVYTGLWGESRAAVCRANRIHLSLASYQPFRTCLTLRLICLLASNGRVIVHERTDWCPLTHEVHLVVCDRHEIMDRVKWLTENADRAEVMAGRCHRFLVDGYRMDDHLRSALQEVGVV